jgi:hypothetical protein
VVAGEGSFVITTVEPARRDGSPRVRFVFDVTMASWDRPILVALRTVLGSGSLNDRPARRAHWQPTSTLRVTSRLAHRRATIPFFDRYLLPCHKRDQFDLWRAALASYDAIHPSRWGNGPSVCSEPDCDGVVRGRGHCRRHYYRATGY